VFVAVAAAIVLLAVAARLSVVGIGPFPATVDAVTTAGQGLAVTLSVTNDGDSGGQTTCRINRVGDGGTGTAAFVTSPRLGSHERRTFEAFVAEFGSTPTDLEVTCRTP
jgi:hypothetical protein